MDDLLKEAIADAKAVRETALENAKIALEEAFTPRLQSMLSKKIQSEMEHGDEEDKDEAAHEEDEDMEERGTEERMHADEDDDVEERMNKDEDDDMEERMHADEDDDVEERMDDKDKDEAAHEEDEDMDENVIEIDGVKYAPVVSEEDDEDKDEAAHEGAHEDDDDVDEDLDLEAVLRELEEEEDEDKDEAMHADEDDDKVEENDVSSNIGSGDNKLDNKAGDTTAIGTKDKAKHNESVEIKEEEDEDEVDEEIDLEEVLAALSEEEDVSHSAACCSRLPLLWCIWLPILPSHRPVRCCIYPLRRPRLPVRPFSHFISRTLLFRSQKTHSKKAIQKEWPAVSLHAHWHLPP